MYSKYGCGRAGSGLSMEASAVVEDVRAFTEARPRAAAWAVAAVVLVETAEVCEIRSTFIFIGVVSHGLVKPVVACAIANAW